MTRERNAPDVVLLRMDVGFTVASTASLTEGFKDDCLVGAALGEVVIVVTLL